MRERESERVCESFRVTTRTRTSPRPAQTPKRDREIEGARMHARHPSDVCARVRVCVCVCVCACLGAVRCRGREIREDRTQCGI